MASEREQREQRFDPLGQGLQELADLLVGEAVYLGRLRVGEKKYEEAIASLTTLIELNPSSPDGNLFLGEAYLQLKKGSKAVPYLNTVTTPCLGIACAFSNQ